MIARRGFLGGLASIFFSGCSASIRPRNRAALDARVDQVLRHMYRQLPYTRDLARRAQAFLVITDVSGLGFIGGSASGEGALRAAQDGYARTLSHHSFRGGSVDLLPGRPKSNHIIFFMTRKAVEDFRGGENWVLRSGTGTTVIDSGLKADINSTAPQTPVIAVAFGDEGLLIDPSLIGGRYRRL